MKLNGSAILIGRLTRMEPEEEKAMTHETGCAWVSTTTFIVGLVAGIGAGLLLAPQSGVRTRRHLHTLAEDLEEQTSHILGDAKTSIGKVIEQGKRLVG